MKAVFAGGGTGGHISPAIALADALKRATDNPEILFFGSAGKLEETLVPKNGYQIQLIKISGFNRRNVIKNISLPFKILSSVNKCKSVLKKFKPDVVVGTGGYVSAPVVYAALKLKIPVLLQEGNSLPGMVTKMFCDKADKVIVNFEDTLNYLKRRDNALVIRHPIRYFPGKANKDDSIKYFELQPGLKTLFVFGGSQGSVSLNNEIKKLLPLLYKLDINLIWQTGETKYEEFRKFAEPFKERVKVLSFIHKMDIAYSASDIVVCRAGISSIAELAVFNMPVILVPFPFASENHQEKNARSLEREGAAIVLTDKELSEKLYNVINETIFNDTKLKILSESIAKYSDTESSNKIAKEILKIA